MNTRSIKAQFTIFVMNSMGSKNPRMDGWYVGITNNENRRKGEHNRNRGKILYWKCLDAGSMKKANEVEKYFSEKGTRNLPSINGATKDSRWVYIFKLPTVKNRGLNGAITDEILYNFIFGD